MLKCSKTKLFIAGISLISVLTIVAAFVIKESKLPFFTKPIPLTTPSPKIPNVLYPIAPDPSGRNIYYIMNDTGKNLRYSGVGVQALSPGTKFTNDKGNVVFTTATSSAMTSYIVGSFKAWEDTPNSKDKYLLLEDLMQTRDEKGNLRLIPRVHIDFSSLGTNFGVEELNSVIPKVLDPESGIKVYKLGLINSWTTQDLQTLIKAGDTLAVTIRHDFKKQKDSQDQEGNIIASWLFIRRYDPKIVLPKELGRSISLQ